ncbi:MAG: ATP-dependent helicase HrpB [Desulfobacteraceae bacterium 4572_35.2]|nr:MAG: ATP-dependent helicase HrpB [Desulfobacteraceae bacterium 4572_35.2]
MNNTSLPIDSILPELCTQLASHSCLVLQAEPGAGKTTRVPLALLDQPWLAGQKILLLEPRRLAAMNAARFMSQSLGEAVGQTVGYTIRHERCVSANTRIEVITEGVLTRRLQSDPMLEEVGLVIFDEFHERNLHSDLGLALTFDAQQGLREDLKLLVMSATLDCDAIANLLLDCPVLHCEGRSYPVETVYLGDDTSPLARRVLKAVVQAVAEVQGDLLVFLPGAREIRNCQRLLQERFSGDELLVTPLYGALPFQQQQHALQPNRKRKVVLATNIAETSLTIAGIGAVIDSGLERRLLFDPASGMDGLVTRHISTASAIQRAGRAGRVQAGHCYRLWSESTHSGLQPHTPAEISCCDLTGLMLELALWGLTDIEQLVWLDRPPQAHLRAATRLLALLGALDSHGRITSRGKQMTALPLHPRLAAMVVWARTVDDKILAGEIAILLEEPDFLPAAHQQNSTDSDVVDRLEYWHHARRAQHPERSIAQCERSLATLLRRLKIKPQCEFSFDVESVGELLLAAFPDRVAQRRGDSLNRYQLRSGAGAQLSFRSQLAPASWLVVARIQVQTDGEAIIHLGSALTRDQIIDHFSDQVDWQDEVFWHDGEQRVVGRQCRRLGALILVQRPQRLDKTAALPIVINQIKRLGLDRLRWSDVSRQWLQRARFVANHAGVNDWPAFDDEQLLDTVAEWLAPWLSGITTLAAIRKVDLFEALRSRLNWGQQQQLDQLAPLRTKVPSGSNVSIDYSDCDQPVLAVKLQELFGLQSSPTIAGGRVTLTVHLLSPARRPLQVTRDLASFWINTYPEVKKELKGRYPKHPWPDDPLVAVAQRGLKKRPR